MLGTKADTHALNHARLQTHTHTHSKSTHKVIQFPRKQLDQTKYARINAHTHAHTRSHTRRAVPTFCSTSLQYIYIYILIFVRKMESDVQGEAFVDKHTFAVGCCEQLFKSCVNITCVFLHFIYIRRTSRAAPPLQILSRLAQILETHTYG